MILVASAGHKLSLFDQVSLKIHKKSKNVLDIFTKYYKEKTCTVKQQEIPPPQKKQNP